MKGAMLSAMREFHLYPSSLPCRTLPPPAPCDDIPFGRSPAFEYHISYRRCFAQHLPSPHHYSRDAIVLTSLCNAVFGASAQAAGVHKMKIQKIPFEEQLVSAELRTIAQLSLEDNHD